MTRTATPSDPPLQPLERRLALSASPAEPLAAMAGAVRQTQDIPLPQHRRDLVPTGRNRFWILEPGHTLTYEGVEDGELKRLVITVTPKTRVVDGIRCRIVIERETTDGALDEISQNYIAIDRRTKNVYYFGEDVNIYEDGVGVSHDGAWLSGVDGAKFGLLMPGQATLGAVQPQERAPGVAEDTGEIIETGRRAHTPAGVFKGSIKVRETTPLEPGNVSLKMYAPNIGLAQDGVLSLIDHTPLDDD